MKKLFSAMLSAALIMASTFVFAQGPWYPGAYPPPGYNQGPYGAPPGYNQGPYGTPPGYNQGPYGPPPGYYAGNRYRGGPPPRGYRNNRRRNFFGFPGDWNDRDGDGPWDMRTFTDPERFWDDMLETPDHLPTMPGGWNVPTVSVPNPVEVGREIGEQTPEMLDAAREY